MSIRQLLTPDERQQLTNSDQAYLRRQLRERTAISSFLNRPVNQRILQQLQCLLDKQPLPRQKAGQVTPKQIRLTDGVRRQCTVRQMTLLECIRYGVDPAILYKEERDGS